MIKKYLPTIITAGVLVLALIITAILVPADRFKKNEGLVIKHPEDEIQYLSGMLLMGKSDAPYTAGDIQFLCNGDGQYRYKAYGADGTPDVITEGFDASKWQSIKNGDIISGTDCRKIAVVSADEKGRVTAYAYFDYVPGVIYGYSNPDQYDDALLYNAENPALQDERAVRLAASLFKSSKADYYLSDYGSIVQGFLSKYSYLGGLLDGYYHTGTDFTVLEGQPFYSPVNGTITYASMDDDYHMIVIYNEEKNISVILLHGADVTPAVERYSLGDGQVSIGDPLGFGGGAGEPAGDMHIHVEVRLGDVTRYKSFSKDISYTRMSNFDPLILADMFQLAIPEADGYDDFTVIGTDGFSAQNNGSVIQVGNWLYYIDEMNGGSIFKARPNGTEVTRLTESSAKNLSYFDGWLYYSDLSQAGHLTKVRADGSEILKLTEVDTSAYVFVTEDWVYFANTLDRNTIFRIKHDGTGREMILSRDISHIFYDGGYFYYTQNARINAERIWRFDPVTKETVQLLESRIDRPFIYNGRLCYRRYYSDKNCLTLPLDVSDEAQAKLLIPSAYNHILPGTRYLVFTNDTDANALYIKLERKDEAIKLSNDVMCSNLTAQGGWIYYYTPVDGGNKLMRINVYGMKKQQLQLDGTWLDLAFDGEEGFADILLAHRTETEFPTPVPEETPIPTETPIPPETTPPAAVTPVPETTTPPAEGEPTPEVTPEATPEGGEATPEITPEVTPEGGETTPEITPEATPEGGEPTPEATPETTPDSTEEPTDDVNDSANTSAVPTA